MLPQAFKERMKELLREEYDGFLQSYDENKSQALRLNSLKGDRQELLSLMPFSLSQVPWEENGFYYEETERPGKHPYHEMGLYYIQEASAMLPATLLDIREGQRVLDLCAAPGGKSTQIGAAMKGKGLLVCNEIHPARAKILSENVERMGLTNAVVTNHSPDELVVHFPEFFDRILVDAPCSGEGMFRKNEEACTEWSPENVRMCGERQDEILDYGARMLAPGGRLVYATCTFSEEENEGSISRFLSRHPEFSAVPLEERYGMESRLPGTLRLFPHKLRGEGHFAAALCKAGASGEEGRRFQGERGLPERELTEYRLFEQELLKEKKEGRFVRFGDQLYLLPEEMKGLKGLKAPRPGLHLGTIKKNRFEPSHGLALSLRKEEVGRPVELPDEETVFKFLRGESFPAGQEKGWRLLFYRGFPIGFGKAAGGIMKNHYPKGLRKNW